MGGRWQIFQLPAGMRNTRFGKRVQVQGGVLFFLGTDLAGGLSSKNKRKQLKHFSIEHLDLEFLLENPEMRLCWNCTPRYTQTHVAEMNVCGLLHGAGRGVNFQFAGMLPSLSSYLLAR